MGKTILVVSSKQQSRIHLAKLFYDYDLLDQVAVYTARLEDAENVFNKKLPNHVFFEFDHRVESEKAALSDFVQITKQHDNITILMQQYDESAIQYLMELNLERYMLASELTADSVAIFIQELMKHSAVDNHNEKATPLASPSTDDYLEKLLGLSLLRNKRQKGIVGFLLLSFDEDAIHRQVADLSIGAAVMLELFNQLNNIMRSSDHVVKISTYQYGLILEDLDHMISCATIAERICQVMTKPLTIMDNTVELRLTIGISGNKNLTVDTQKLFNEANVAQQTAALQPGSGYTFFEPALNTVDNRRKRLINDLEGTLNRGEFYLLFQPIHYFDNSVFYGCDVLLRWNHPELDIVGPKDFVPVTQSLGMLEYIVKWVIQHFHQQYLQWQINSSEPFSLYLKINPSMLLDDTFVAEMQTLIQPLLASNIEIVFSMKQDALTRLHKRREEIYRNIDKLKCYLCIEDVGLIDLNLRDLSHRVVKSLKLSLDFSRFLYSKKEYVNIAGALAGIGQALGLNVIATGIENRQQRNRFQELNYSLGQGYYFTKPISCEQLHHLLLASKGDNSLDNDKDSNIS